jgi:parvulin-like peptidyl-prolyl isomerase
MARGLTFNARGLCGSTDRGSTACSLGACLSAVGVLAIASMGCAGGDDPALTGDAVVKVGDTVIGIAELRGRVREERARAATSPIAPVRYDPPHHVACIAGKRRQAASRKGGGRVGAALLKKDCRRGYEELKERALRSLIRSEWIRQAADELSIEVSDTAAKEAAEGAQKRLFASEAAYRKFLKAAGINDADFVARARLDVLALRVTQELQRNAAELSDEDVEAYYKSHKSAFRWNELRPVRVLVSKTRAKAQQGKAALQSGMSWSRVVSKYSTAAFIRRLGGTPIYAENGKGPIDRHIFGAREGQIVGPVKLSDTDGWEVFQAGAIRPPSQKPLREVVTEIRLILQESMEQRVDADFIASYKAKTICATGYRVPDCGNRPTDGSGERGSS